MSIRTRIAPSPTGDPHVGTAYIALFNYCLAKSRGGEFILRIEDTDQKRSTKASEDAIFEALKWVGIEWDEGPDVGGPHGPYRQSERSELYAEHAQKLLDSGHAFRCFCTQDRLRDVRAKQREAGEFQGYDGHCIGLDDDEVQRRVDAGEKNVVRMKVPREGTCVVEDYFRDDIEIEWATVDMQVLVKSDGLPTYHLANVVDDHHMEITHVMRGEEWITSAPKHLLLYKYFGWDAPTLAHLPLLRNPDKSKLSKRKNPTSILYYERMGYLPEALLNYLGMMAWSMGDDEEKFSLDEMVEAFDLDRISLGAPVFDVEKLTWLNGRYIREDNTPEQLLERMKTWALNEEYALKILEISQKRCDTLTDFEPMVGFFFRGMVDPSEEDLTSGKLDAKECRRVMQIALWRLETHRDWESASLMALMRETSEILDVKFRDFLKPFFVAISGSTSSTPLFDTMAILGPDLSRARIRHAIEVLGGLGKKKLRKLEKYYDTMLAEHESGSDDE